MSKKSNHKNHSKQSWLNTAKPISLVLIAAIVLVIGLATFWKTPSLKRGVSTLSLPQATPTPLKLSKEYIYAGNKLVATKQMLEGDVVSTPEGDGLLTVRDWVKMGRYAAGLDTIPTGSEFQRADCAPRSSRGNGMITVSDWVQAGRYIVALDPPTVAWGPVANLTPHYLEPSAGVKGELVFAVALPYISLNPFLNRATKTPWSPGMTRTVRVVSPNFVGGQNGAVQVELDSQGNENAIGVSLTFNTAQLTYVSAVKGSDASAASLNVNSSGATSGRVGLAVSMPSGQTFSSGTKQVVVVTFSASSSGSHVVSSGNQPVYREVADVNGNELTTTFTP